MKFLTTLEKKREFWYLLGISFLFFLLRLPSLIEPYWYGDEGIYEVIGLAMRDGRILYAEIWDNKPPLLYLVYALVGPDQFSVRLASLVSGIAAVVSLFYLSTRLFRSTRVAVITTILFATLFAIPNIEGNIANAENFMLFPILLGGIFVWLATEKRESVSFLTPSSLRFFGGLLLGFAFLFKIVGIFDFLAFFLFTVFFLLHDEKIRRTHLKKRLLSILATALPLLIGFLIPYAVTLLYFLLNNALMPYIQATFFSNIGYVGHGNEFLIPQGLLLIKLALLIGAVVFIFLRRNILPLPLQFVLLWLVFSLFNAFFSQRPYTHYVLVLLPALCLLVGSIFRAKKQLRYILAGMLVVSLFLVYKNFSLHSIQKTFSYYENYLQFVTQQKPTSEYQAFFDRDTPRDYEIASFLRANMNATDSAFIWGNSAQIYVLANTLPPGRYTVAYHMVSSEQTLRETEGDLARVKPRFIVKMPDIASYPFSLSDYTQSYSIRDTYIYERTY